MMANKDDSKNNLDNLIKQITEKIGINVLLFQKIERGLKVILPFVSKPEDSNKTKEEINKKREKVKLQTLGVLVNTLNNSISITHDDFNIPDYLKQIVDERNKLIHNFNFSQLSTKEDCEKCLVKLERQRKEAFIVYKEIYLLVYMLLSMLHKQYGDSNEKIKLQHQEARKILLTMIENIEYIDEENPCYTIWENTQIVKLLKLAETEIEKINNMTLLSKAGQFIKSKNRESTPKKYGVKTLKDIVKVPDLFEIVEFNKGFILYKSK